MKKWIMIALLLLLMGCSTQKITSMDLTVYQQEPVKYQITEEKAMEEVRNLCEEALKGKTRTVEGFDSPKGVTYQLEVRCEKETEVYEFVPGYLIKDNKVYTMEHYEDVIEKLKQMFEAE